MSALTQAPGSAGSAAMRDGIAMTVRHVRALLREPAWIAITLTTPVIWLLLFGSLFERAVEIPGFGSGDYTDFFTPVWW
jgi:ABC-2 type transport system permease protein